MKNKKGIGLILAVFFIVITALISIIFFSILTSGTTSGLNYILSNEAYGITYGGMQWYLEQLREDTDWTNQTNLTNIALGKGVFDITINSASATIVSFSVTGRITGYDGQYIQKKATITAKKIPKAGQFALWWGRRTGTILQLNNTSISGDYWSRASTNVTSSSSIKDGIAYRPDNEDIIGTGTYTEQAVGSPYPEMPVITTTYYDNFISNANTLIDSAAGYPDYNCPAVLNLTGNTIRCNNFRTNGNTIITGYGRIVAYNMVELLYDTADSGTLQINPSGGSIEIYAGTYLLINSSQTDTHIRIDGTTTNRVVLYSRASTSTSQYTLIQRDSIIYNAFIVGNRRIIVRTGAQIYNSTLYLNYQPITTNNYLAITNTGTIVGSASSPCNVISLSGLGSSSTHGLEISSGASVAGFIYHYGGTTGRTYFVNNAFIMGTVIASQFRGDGISGTTITYNSSFVPPVGFEGYVTADIQSWDDQ